MAALNLQQLLNRYSAFMFDMDGTLLDSSTAIAEVTTRWCAKHNLDVQSILKICHGGRLCDLLPKIAPHLDAQKEHHDFVAQEALITTGIVEITGAHALLTYLTKSQHPWAIATSSPEPAASVRLKAAGLPKPTIFVTGDQVNQGKPHPEPFQLTAAKLKQKPNQCLVFEDSNYGVEAALLAGCDVVVIGDHVTLKSERIVARISHYQDLVEQIANLSVTEA